MIDRPSPIAAAATQCAAASGARAALASIATALVDLTPARVSSDPLSWPGYRAQLAAAAARTGETESVIVAEGDVGRRRVTIIAFDFRFLGGSMGQATGDRIVAAFSHAIEHRQPLLSIVATGGARIQEGMLSLSQMQRISHQVARLRRSGLPHLSVVQHPTTGGVWATLVSSADVIIAVQGATAAFAGHRVTGAARDAPHEAYSAAAKFHHGFIDLVAPADELAAILGRYMALLGRAGEPAQPPPLPAYPRPPTPIASGWAAVQRARSPQRPRAHEYLAGYFDQRVTLSGDRTSGRDPAMLCGFGNHHQHTIAYIAQTGSPNTPAGYRTAARLLKLADRLNIPILTLIDTPGAQHDQHAETHGIGHAISDTFIAMAQTNVPVTSIVIGEGGSGGALSLAKPGHLWATPDSYFSVTAPEAAASIIYHDTTHAPQTANQLHLGPHQLIHTGIANAILQ